MSKISIILSFIFLSFLTHAQVKTHSDVKYGPHERNVFDLWLPQDQKTNKPTPLVVYIHAGGFSSGDKNLIEKLLPSVLKMNQLGWAVAAINYRFLVHTSLQNIMREDIAGFVQYIRANAKTYNINKKKIVTFGSSAGGSAGLWLGTHDDVKNKRDDDPVKKESSRILAFAHLNAQAGYDFIDWYEYFGKELTDFYMKDQIWTRYHLSGLSDLTTPEGNQIRAELDSVENMDEGDAAMFLYNSYAAKEVKDWDYDYYIHGPQHANVLLKRAKAVNLNRQVYIRSNQDKMPSSMMDAVIDFFKQQFSYKLINIRRNFR